MTEQTTKPAEAREVTLDRDEVVRPLTNGINALAVEVRRNSVAHGFGDHGDRLRADLAIARTNLERHENGGYTTQVVGSFRRALAEAEENYSAYVGNRLMLIAGEVTEAHEELRNSLDFSTRFTDKGKPEGFGSELADVLIRLLDTAEELEVNLEEELLLKMTFNYGRPAMHGRKF